MLPWIRTRHRKTLSGIANLLFLALALHGCSAEGQTPTLALHMPLST
jgi:hypothetical protein